MHLQRRPSGVFLFNIIPRYRPGFSDILDFARYEGRLKIYNSHKGWFDVYKLAYGIPSLTGRILQNGAYKNWEGRAGAGLSALDLLYYFATDGDRDFAKINWKNPLAFECDEVSTMVFNENIGFLGAGGYINTNWVPSTDAVAYQQNNASVGIWVNNNVAQSDFCAYGTRRPDGTGSTYFQPRRASDNMFIIGPNAGSRTIASQVNTAGLYHARRTTATATNLFKNGTQLNANNAIASEALSTQAMLINALNNTTGPGLAGIFEIGMFWAGASMSGQESNIYGDWRDDYQTVQDDAFQNVIYSSSIDAITNLFMRVCYDGTATDQPVVILVHGWSQSASNFLDSTLQRFKDNGVFVAAVGLRSRDGASGTRDASGRELYDIYDAIEYIKTNYASKIDETKITVIGYSGGGGNVLGFVSRFPDQIALGVSFFGMSDYGYDGTFGWYQQTAGEQAALSTAIGGTPAAVPNEYKARQSMWSASNFKGKLRVYHDVDDASVNVNHSQRLVTQLISDGFTNYVYSESNSGSADRWIHGLPNTGQTGQENIAAEANIIADVFANSIPTMPLTGTLKVNGGVQTELFKIWFGNGTAAQDTKNRRATVVYDYSANSYEVTPSLDAPATDMTVEIDILSGVHAGKTVTQTISSVTTLTPV